MLMAEHLISAKSALDLAEYRSNDTDPELLISDLGTVMVLLKNRDKSIRMRILFHKFYIQHQIELWSLDYCDDGKMIPVKMRGLCPGEDDAPCPPHAALQRCLLPQLHLYHLTPVGHTAGRI